MQSQEREKGIFFLVDFLLKNGQKINLRRGLVKQERG